MYSSPKIIFAKMAKNVEAYIDVSGEYASINTNCIYNICKDIDILFVGGFCNSKLFQFVYGIYFGGIRMSGGYFQYQAPQLRLMPIIKLSKMNQRPIIDLVKEIISKICLSTYSENKELQDEVLQYERKIDQEVYKLYGLSKEEIEIVEQ